MTLLRRRYEALCVRELEREALLLDMASEHVHQLNETASFIWLRLDGATSAERLAGLLASEYDVDVDLAKRDVLTTLNRLKSLNLVTET